MYVPAPQDPIPVQTLRFVDYLRGVLPNEWRAEWPDAALDVGAVAVKQYAWYHAFIHPKWSSRGYAFDLLDNTCDQYYRDNSADQRTDVALARTWFTVLTRNSALFPLYYRALVEQCGTSADCLGQVESAQLASAGKSAADILAYYYSPAELLPVAGVNGWSTRESAPIEEGGE